MTLLFYALFFISIFILEAGAFLNPELLLASLKEAEEYPAKIKKDKTTKLPSAYIFEAIYLVFLLIGLITSQWLLFLLIILISFIPKKAAWWIKIDSALSIIIAFAIIFNKFHLHIDLFRELKSIILH